MTADPNVGRRIADRFVLEMPIGAGGMGRIYRARDERLGAAVALKLLKRALLDDEVLRERFRREARSLAKLRHSGIVGVLDFGETDQGDLYTALELVEGRTLGSLMDLGALAVERALPLCDQLLAALEVCHAAGVVHRDVKPSNVMVIETASGQEVKLIDFGLVRLEAAGTDTLTETGAVQGTPLYMAPEQCRGEEVGPKTDVYAFGVVMYQMLSGVPPFQGTDAATIMAAQLFVDPPSLTTLVPRLAPGLAAAVQHALAKRPDDRPTAGELREALALATSGADPTTRSAHLADVRNAGAKLTRKERMLERGEHDPAPQHGAPTVLVWMAHDERAAAVAGCLGTAKIKTALHGEPSLPNVERIDVVVVALQHASTRIAALREVAPKLPVVVLDVASPEDTTTAIRAGANDMLHRDAPLAELPKKIARLARRRRVR